MLTGDRHALDKETKLEKFSRLLFLYHRHQGKVGRRLSKVLGKEKRKALTFVPPNSATPDVCHVETICRSTHLTLLGVLTPLFYGGHINKNSLLLYKDYLRSNLLMSVAAESISPSSIIPADLY